MDESRARRVDLAATAAALGLFTWQASLTWESVVDDAYISARYAEHLASGYGLVYNAGEPPVEGITNLLWTVLLAIGRLPGIEMHTLLTVLGFLFGVAAVLVAMPLTRQLSGERHLGTLVPTFMVASSPHLAVAATNGLESSMMVAMVGWTVWAHLALEGSRRWITAALAAALILTRPEGIAVAGLLCLHDLWQHRAHWRAALPLVAATAITFTGLTLFRLGYYGDWLPNTFAAKSSFPIYNTFRVNADYLKPETWLLIATGAAGVLGVALKPWNTRRAATFAVWAVLAFAPFTVNLWMPGLRLFLPAMLLAACLVGASLAATRPNLRAFGAVVLLGACAWFTFSNSDRVRHYDWRHSVKTANGTERACKLLAEQAPPGSWLATRDAGVLAYYVGTGVKIAELHQRSLTQPHPGGNNSDVESYTPVNPEFFVATQRRDHSTELIYNNDRKIFGRFTEPYRYIGRVHQHYHRYYDFYVRTDVPLTGFPSDVVENFNGPKAPARKQRKHAPEPVDPTEPARGPDEEQP